MTGSVPAGSGLSSSAAMVVASTLAFLAVNNKLDAVTKGKLVEMSMENEKRVGGLCEYKFYAVADAVSGVNSGGCVPNNIRSI